MLVHIRATWLTWILLATLTLALLALGVDRASNRSEEGAWNPRVAQRQQLRYLSAYVTDYGRRFGRPAFHLDSVEAHLDSATRAKFADYRTDIWGNRVHYWWDETSFTLTSSAGLTSKQRTRKEDSIAASWKARGRDVSSWHAVGVISRRLSVIERYGWPTEVRGRRNSLGQFTQSPQVNAPFVVR